MSTRNSAGGPALSAQGLTKRFGNRIAFQDVSFEIGYSEVFGFLGPNGAGKTTTVRTLGTLIAPTAGSATVAGLALTPENGVRIRQRVSIMPEAPGLYLRLTVKENLECFAGLYAVSNVHQRIERVLQAVNLSGRANDPCRALSKGLRQRVNLARALLDAAGAYVVSVSDSTPAAPAITRALVAADADVLSIAESQHTLEDVYMELINEDVEAGEP